MLWDYFNSKCTIIYGEVYNYLIISKRSYLYNLSSYKSIINPLSILPRYIFKERGKENAKKK